MQGELAPRLLGQGLLYYGVLAFMAMSAGGASLLEGNCCAPDDVSWEYGA